MPLNYQLTTHLATDVGLVRSNNEDSLAEDRELGLLVLADGMGGYQAGEVASAMTTDRVISSLRSAASRRIDTDVRNECRLLERAVQAAHAAVHQASAVNMDQSGMGTTVVACWFRGNAALIAHVGDSRAYRFRRGELAQLTQDHSLLEELVARGHYSRTDAQKLVRRNIVTRAIGVDDEVRVDILQAPLEDGDLYLLCSDGLTDMVEDSDIRQLIDTYHGDPPKLASELIAAALSSGGKDNVSVALARVDFGEPGKAWTDVFRRWLPGS